MQNTPLISICIPTYNAAPFIAETIEYWSNQTYQNLEIIIQDDCSTDGSYEIATAVSKSEPRLSVFKNTQNLGIGKNWNEAYQRANGEYIVIFNADDKIEPLFLEKALDALLDISIDLVSFRFTHLDTSENREWKHQPQNDLKDGVIEDLFEKIFFEMPFSWDFTLVRARIFKELEVSGSLFLSTQICDAELWYRVGLKNLKLYYCDYNAGFYVKHKSNNSKIAFSEDKSFIDDVLPKYNYILNKHFGLRYRKFLKTKAYHIFKKATKKFNLLGFRLFYNIFFMFYNKVK